MNKTLTALLNNPDDFQRHLKPLLKHLPDVTSMLLVIAIAHILAVITWALLSDPEAITTAPLSPVKTMSQSNNQQAFRQLTNAHLFGIMGVSKPTAVTHVPETKLNLVLKGILAAELMERASAIISRGKGGKEEVFGLGDKMPGGVTIKEIHSDHIILDSRGKLETLRLSKDSGNGSVSLHSKTKGKSKLKTLKNIHKKIATNPASFTEYALPVVVKKNGRQLGYKLQPRQNSDVLRQMGIQPTDTITSINGMKLDNPTNSLRALRKLKTAKQINLMVLRNGERVPLNIKLQ
jgi:general secretion pathway protein C